MKTSVGVSISRKVHMDSDVLFRRLLAVSKQREVSMETVMSHELAAVPPSLFYDDGSMRKTTKADLAKKLEAVVEETQQLPNVEEPSAYIIDGMALLQSLNDSTFQTFNDLGECVWKKIATLWERKATAVSLLCLRDMTTNTQSKILKDKEEALFKPADEHISSQDKQVFQTRDGHN